ncbi:MAG: hypothetical protein ACJAUC_003831 [Planctomycetota bacterium]|jgi:hypothetical protein
MRQIRFGGIHVILDDRFQILLANVVHTVLAEPCVEHLRRRIRHDPKHLPLEGQQQRQQCVDGHVAPQDRRE